MNANDKPIDLDRLRDMYGQDALAELLELCLKESREIIGQLDELLKAGDISAAAAQAHQLKGVALTMTINEMSEISAALEKQLKQHDANDTAVLMDNLKAAFIRLESYLKETNCS